MPANTPVKVPSFTSGLLLISTGIAVLVGAYAAAYAFTGTVERSPESEIINEDGTTSAAPGFVAHFVFNSLARARIRAYGIDRGIADAPAGWLL